MSSIYAVIVGGVVSNLIMWDGVSPYNPGAGVQIVLAKGPAAVGGTYDGTNFIAPSPATQSTSAIAIAVSLSLGKIGL